MLFRESLIMRSASTSLKPSHASVTIVRIRATSSGAVLPSLSTTEMAENFSSVGNVRATGPRSCARCSRYRTYERATLCSPERINASST